MFSGRLRVFRTSGCRKTTIVTIYAFDEVGSTFLAPVITLERDRADWPRGTGLGQQRDSSPGAVRVIAFRVKICTIVFNGEL